VSFEEFVAHRLGVLLRYATVLTCDPHQAQDIVQDVLMRVQSRWSRISAMDQAEAYVKRMVLNDFLSWRRRVRRVRPVSLDVLDAMLAGPADQTAMVDERDELVARIAGLPPKQRAVIVLRFYEGLTDPEVADLLQCREVTVRSHASRALATLRAAMTTPAPVRGTK
jgi:RNA polymerase sigma-70 factor (sigma-E family)